MEDIVNQEMEIPLAQSPDLVSSLLSISSHDLGMRENEGEHFLLQKACDLKNWALSGSHPKYTIDQWIEVLITGSEQAHCRIFNCRTHHSVRPLTLQGLIETIHGLLLDLDKHHTPANFGKVLLNVYFELLGDKTDLKLFDLFRTLQQRYPNYRREAFGLDLFFAIENNMLEGYEVSLLAGGNCPHIELFTLGEAKGPQLVHRLLLSPITELQNLDI